MELLLNHAVPTIMHVDLNSCFATIEQQAYPNLRGKPLVVAAYTTPAGFILTPSIEAKRYGIKMGMRVREAQSIFKHVIVRDPDPPMIRFIHTQLRDLLWEYSPRVTPKSIDEFVIDFNNNPHLERGLVHVGKEMKMRIREKIGDWISCSIGISTNRFLAKLAASLHKPNGLDVITENNLRSVLSTLTLVDLPGINIRLEKRLNAENIFTPIQFLDADALTLQYKVFKSIVGKEWYKKLRGWETDDKDFERKSIGQQYALPQATNNPQALSRILMKLCEKMGRRLRKHQLKAYGMHIACTYNDFTFWQMGKKMSFPSYTTSELFQNASWILGKQPKKKNVRGLSVSSFELVSTNIIQQTLFDDREEKRKNVQKAMDAVNDTWGEFMVRPALMMGMDDIVLDRIAFGRVRDVEER